MIDSVYSKMVGEWFDLHGKTLEEALPARCRDEFYFLCRIGNSYGYCDYNGLLQKDLLFDYARPFCEGLAVVRKNEKKWGIINRKFDVIWVDGSFDDFSNSTNGIFIATRANIYYSGEWYDFEEWKSSEFYKDYEYSYKNTWDLVERGTLFLSGQVQFVLNQFGEFIMKDSCYVDMNEKTNNFVLVVSKGGSIGVILKDGKNKLMPQFRKLEIVGDSYLHGTRHQSIRGTLQYYEDEGWVSDYYTIEDYYKIENGRFVEINEKEFEAAKEEEEQNKFDEFDEFHDL